MSVEKLPDLIARLHATGTRERSVTGRLPSSPPPVLSTSRALTSPGCTGSRKRTSNVALAPGASVRDSGETAPAGTKRCVVNENWKSPL